MEQRITLNNAENKEKICYLLLTKVFIEGGYSTISLDAVLSEIPPQDRAYITRLFYGVIEKSIQFDYIIQKLTQKPPKKPIAILIKIGLYLLRYSDMPAYAAIDKTVSLVKEVGKGGVSGFVNATLRASQNITLPQDNLSIILSYPKWVTDKLEKRYGTEFCIQMLQRRDKPHRHIRRNPNKITQENFEILTKSAEKSPLGCYADADTMRRLKPDQYTVQSLSSMLAVRAYLSGEKFGKVLDVCAAPGGKAVLIKQLTKDAKVVANDIHPHRVELIKKYAYRLGVQLDCTCFDATKPQKEWQNAFDLVVCDVPCSGLGVKAKPDILLNRTEKDLEKLAQLQYQILQNAATCVCENGVLCYSTCTIFKEENEDVIEKFLANFGENSAEKSGTKPVFRLEKITDSLIGDNDGWINLYPAKYNSDGFFVCRLRRIK